MFKMSTANEVYGKSVIASTLLLRWPDLTATSAPYFPDYTGIVYTSPSSSLPSLSSSTHSLYSIDVNVPSYLLLSYIMIGVTGTSGNLLIFSVLIIQGAKFKNTTEKLLLHQTIIDGVTSILVIIVAVFPPPSSYPAVPSVWEDFLCRAWATQLPMWVGFSSSCFNLVAITFEQYFAIVHPVFHKVNLQHINLAIPVSLVWLSSATCTVLSFIPVSSIVDGVCLAWSSYPSFSAAAVTATSYLLYYLAIPTAMMVGCFFHMIVVVHKKSRQTVPSGMASTLSQTKISMMKTLVIFVATYLCCWSYNVWALALGVVNVIDASFFQTWQFHISVLLVFASCSINPFIYAINNKKFRKNLQNCQQRILRGQRVDDNVNITEGSHI